MIKTLTRTEYNAKARHGYAGPAATLQPETVAGFQRNTDWNGKHWAMWNEGGKGTVLGPVNVTENHPRNLSEAETLELYGCECGRTTCDH